MVSGLYVVAVRRPRSMVTPASMPLAPANAVCPPLLVQHSMSEGELRGGRGESRSPITSMNVPSDRELAIGRSDESLDSFGDLFGVPWLDDGPGLQFGCEGPVRSDTLIVEWLARHV